MYLFEILHYPMRLVSFILFYRSRDHKNYKLSGMSTIMPLQYSFVFWGSGLFRPKAYTLVCCITLWHCLGEIRDGENNHSSQVA